MIGIGIDTGGTCTDCVIMDTNTGEVLSWAKTQTTRRDLKKGIVNALKKVDSGLLEKAEYLSLSTTLATNACVEEKGGRAKLCFIGLNPKAIDMMSGVYGLPSTGEITFFNGEDWDDFEDTVAKHFGEYDSIAVVQLNPVKDDGEKEKRAEEVIKSHFDIPVVRGYDLYQEINVQKRGATALLNARLIPVMEEFITSIDRSLRELGLDVPIRIVKSDGTVMSREYALSRPVETLLSGPAASIIGATKLSDSSNALICDMGGTTTDCAVLKNGIPLTSDKGITIGRWKTMVKGVSIDTFALGGDTGIGYYHGEVVLEERRAIPLSALAAEYPYVEERLEELVSKYRMATYPAATFLVLQTSMSEEELAENPKHYSKYEIKLIQALKDGPLIYEDAAQRTGLSPYVLNTKRLEDEGVIIRSKVTPTDAMHYKGDFRGYSTRAAELGLRYYAFVLRKSVDEVAERIYELVEERLYSNLVRILLGYENEGGKDRIDDAELRKLTSLMFERYNAHMGFSFAEMKACTATGIMGIGAPTGIFLRPVAKYMGEEADIPAYAMVANAVGAALGRVLAEYRVRIVPDQDHYMVIGGGKPKKLDLFSDAVKEATETARQRAEEKARAEGAEGDLEIIVTRSDDYFDIHGTGSSIHVATEIIAKAGIAD